MKEINFPKEVKNNSQITKELIKELAQIEKSRLLYEEKETAIKNLRTKILEKRCPLALIKLYQSILISKNTKLSNQYLKEDLQILPEFIAEYMKSFIPTVIDTFNDDQNLKYHKYNQEVFGYGEEFVCHIREFIRSNGELKAFEYLLREYYNLDISIISEVYNKLDAKELAFIYSWLHQTESHILGDYHYEDDARNTFYESIQHRNSEEIFEFLKTIQLFPCNEVYGLIFSNLALLNHYNKDARPHLLQTISWLFKENEIVDYFMIANCLDIAEFIKSEKQSSKTDDGQKTYIDYYYMYYNKKRKK